MVGRMKKILVYEYEKCSTCRDALKFLASRSCDVERRPIVDRPPSRAELKKMLGYLGGDLKRLFNTSGQVYRELKLGEKLPKMTESEALELLASDGKLIKRPFVLGEGFGVVGFREEEWKRLGFASFS